VASLFWPTMYILRLYSPFRCLLLRIKILSTVTSTQPMLACLNIYTRASIRDPPVKPSLLPAGGQILLTYLATYFHSVITRCRVAEMLPMGLRICGFLLRSAVYRVTVGLMWLSDTLFVSQDPFETSNF